ncbi:MAG TPA: hypothetical protein PLV72_00075 [Candidatus Magasanikbacteria bacterium]|nr:hypothetical protein [Candidatus Magasanikbacteria bacterium]
MLASATLSTLFTFFIQKKFSPETTTPTENHPPKQLPVKIAAVLLSISILITFLTHTTTGILTSPWLILPNYTYALYSLFIFCVLLIYRRGESRPYFAILAFFITYSVVSFIYRLGFGYDPFLHRAAEKHILENGFILPKTPFYIGQYTIVVSLAKILPFALKFFDIWLTPVFTAIIIPITAFIGFHKSEVFVKYKSFAPIFAILALPLATFIFTTPNNLANVFLLSLILISPAILTNKLPRATVLPFMVLSALAHPLPGIFALLFGTYLLMRRSDQKTSTPLQILFVLIALIAIPTFMLVWSKIANSGISFEWRPFFTNAKNFLKVFTDPYYFRNNPIPFYLDIIYLYRKLVYIILVALATWQAIKNRSARIYLACATILTFNAYLLAASLSIRDLSTTEEISYAIRILQIATLFLIPPAIATFTEILAFTKKFDRVLIIFLTLAIFCSWYLTYPQSNKKVYFPGQNVTKADYETAQYIHDDNPNNNYIVLTNIITAAASIEKYGFTKYFDLDGRPVFNYSTPSGSPLYDAYLKFTYGEHDKKIIDDLYTKTGAEKIYYALSRKWADFEKISTAVEKTTPNMVVIGDDEIKIFTYCPPNDKKKAN